MGRAFYELLDESAPGASHAEARVRSTEHTIGPWDPRLQHAGPPAALLTRAIRHLTGLPEGGLPARLCFDILAPVPVAELVVRSGVVRPGRRIGLAEAELAPAAHPDRPVMTLRAWVLRRRPQEDMALALLASEAPAPAGRDAPVMPRPDGWRPGYLDAIEWRWGKGRFEQPGPAAVWARVLVTLIDGESLDPVERLVAVADSASGISAVADPRDVLFVNTDLTLHLNRPPRGEEIWMTASTVVHGCGVGCANGELGDCDGAVARSAQTLFVEPRAAARG